MKSVATTYNNIANFQRICFRKKHKQFHIPRFIKDTFGRLFFRQRKTGVFSPFRGRLLWERWTKKKKSKKKIVFCPLLSTLFHPSFSALLLLSKAQSGGRRFPLPWFSFQRFHACKQHNSSPHFSLSAPLLN